MSSIETWRTTKEVAAMFGVTLKCVTRWVHRGDLRAHKFGRGFLFSEADLAAFSETRVYRV